uniref:DUF19 domain-containing protein n=1 Tax=Rhabditophanes sp. KR3021 TaxID=114890 RepID=A0AC35TU18_9BILA
MKITLFLVALLASTSVNAFLTNVYDLIPEQYLPALFPIGSGAAVKNCIDQNFNYCQSNFNTAIGAVNTLNWRNGAALALAVQKQLTGSPASYAKVCQARTKFSTCMGSMFSSCINRFSLMARPNAVYLNVLTYVNIYTHLDFLCNSGFEIFIDSTNFLEVIKNLHTPATINCDNAFSAAVTTNAVDMCTNAATYASCYQTSFGVDGFVAVAWAMCNDIVVGFGNDCQNLRCFVNPNGPH